MCLVRKLHNNVVCEYLFVRFQIDAQFLDCIDARLRRVQELFNFGDIFAFDDWLRRKHVHLVVEHFSLVIVFV